MDGIKIEEIKNLTQFPERIETEILRKELAATKKELESFAISNAKLKVEIRSIMTEVSELTRFFKFACENMNPKSEKSVNKKKTKLDYKHDLCKCGKVKLIDSPVCRKCWNKNRTKKPQKKKRK